MAELDRVLALAQRVAREAHALGIDTALIGAMALARHGFVRGTSDVDLGACVTLARLAELAARLRELGLIADLRRPDLADPLNGVLDARAQADDEPIQIINFRGDPGKSAVARSKESDGFSCVRLPDLIALKLFAGSRFDLADVEGLLEANPDADLGEIRSVCAASGLEESFDAVLVRAR
ncbi:MAG: hypothetical protein HYV07_24855 [Deltaproteobacteria bacterium]|nr:hypothetical protein [Deltaproteobacteria bacterium]